MRKAFIGLALATTVLAAPAVARDGSTYLGIEGGVVFGDDLSIDYDLDGDGDIETGEAGLVQFDLDRGWEGDIVLGHDFGAFRLEAEGAYKQMGADAITATGGVDLDPATPGVQTSFAGGVEGKLRVASAMVNALVDLGSDDSVNFYAGGGVGYAWAYLNGNETDIDDAFVDDLDNGFAWQLIGGVRVPVSDSVDVGLKYRYFNLDNVDMFTEEDDAFRTNLSSHSVLASLLFNFGGQPEPAPLPPPAPVRAAPPPPPPPPAPQTRTCPDGTVVMASQACPVPPPPVVPRTGERG